MASFGESLRQERLRRQISLDQVAEVTKINQRFLQAIEDERLQELPGGVFNRNFIRNYARYLGLDEDHYVEEYIRSTGDAARTSELPEVPSRPQEPLLSGATLLGVLIAGMVVLVIWAVVHLYRQQLEMKALKAKSEPAQSMAPPSPAPPARQLIASPGVTDVQPAEASNAPVANAHPVTALAAKGAAPVVGSSTQPSPAPAGEKALIVAATIQPAWIAVYTDGQWRLEATLKPGEQKEVFFHTRVRVVSGNAGVTVISIDGKPMGTLGKIGRVAHFSWPAGSADTAPLPALHLKATTGNGSGSNAGGRTATETTAAGPATPTQN